MLSLKKNKILNLQVQHNDLNQDTSKATTTPSNNGLKDKEKENVNKEKIITEEDIETQLLTLNLVIWIYKIYRKLLIIINFTH